MTKNTFYAILILATAGVASSPARCVEVGFEYFDGIYTTLDVPGSRYTEAFGINNEGQVVGEYNDSTGTHGFLYSGGVYTALNNPGPTTAWGINSSGKIVGSYQDGNHPQNFVYSAGKYSTLTIGPSWSVTQGISNNGQIVGSYNNASSNGVGFLYKGGSYSTIAVPGATLTYPHGVNNAGQIVGEYNSPTYGSFLYSDGSYTILNDPQAKGTQTTAIGINDRGQVVGYYVNSNNIEQSFLYDVGTASYINLLGLPQDAQAWGINDEGVIVGFYDNGSPAVTPLPAALPLFASGLGALGLIAWRRKRKTALIHA